MAQSPAVADTGGPARWLFLRLLGVVYLAAFAGLAPQVTGLVGRHGLLPAGAFLDWAHSIYGGTAYRLLPTIFWLGASDGALRAACWAGVGLAGLLIAGVAPRPVLATLWLLYLSLSVAGQDFLSFQWDALLLEAGLLAVLWAPGGVRPARDGPPPSVAVRWLLGFLLFKLMFLSGATKLLSGDPTWRQLTALDYHFWTQPLPTPLAWYAHQLPAGVHRAATGVMFAIELMAPWLVLVPTRWRGLRRWAVLGLVLLQAGIALTGNYGFFNLLAVVLCVPVLDDALLARVVPLRAATAGRAAPRRRVGFELALVGVVGGLSAMAAWVELATTLPGGRGAPLVPRWTEAVLTAVAPVRSFNGYGLFRVMTTERPELVLEVSRDGRQWLEYPFRYQPGVVSRAPRFIAPYQPRLDWQLWFAALDPAGSASWLGALMERLRDGSPDVRQLMGDSPLPEPPRFIRLARYDYRFTTPAERAARGAWWHRDLVGYLPDLR